MLLVYLYKCINYIYVVSVFPYLEICLNIIIIALVLQTDTRRHRVRHNIIIGPTYYYFPQRGPSGCTTPQLTDLHRGPRAEHFPSPRVAPLCNCCCSATVLFRGLVIASHTHALRVTRLGL